MSGFPRFTGPSLTPEHTQEVYRKLWGKLRHLPCCAGEIKLLEGRGTSPLMWPRSRCCCTYFCCSSAYICETDHCYKKPNAYSVSTGFCTFSHIDCAVNLRVGIGWACTLHTMHASHPRALLEGMVYLVAVSLSSGRLTYCDVLSLCDLKLLKRIFFSWICRVEQHSGSMVNLASLYEYKAVSLELRVDGTWCTLHMLVSFLLHTQGLDLWAKGLMRVHTPTYSGLLGMDLILSF